MILLFTSIGRTRIFTESIHVLNEDDLLEGSRFPDLMNEIIIAEDLSIYLDAVIGDVVTLRTALFEPLEFVIVGIANRVNKGVYFSDQFFCR